MRRSVDSVLSEQTRNIAAMARKIYVQARRGTFYNLSMRGLRCNRCTPVYTSGNSRNPRNSSKGIDGRAAGTKPAVQINLRPMRPRGTRPNRTEKQCQCAVPPPAHRWGALVDLTSGTGPCRTVTSICRIVQHSYCIVLNGTQLALFRILDFASGLRSFSMIRDERMARA